ncbi:MAG: TRAP transporter small permease [Desulfatiglandales bacterium]
MAYFPNQVRRFVDFLNVAAGISLLGMTALTFADVVLRMFRRPILGTYEIVEFLGAAVAAFAMAHTTLQRAHVAVEVIVMRLSMGLQKAIYVITHLLSIFLFVLLAYECIRYGNDFRIYGEVSMTLRFPFYPILYGMSVASVAVCLVLLMDLWFVLTRREPPYFRWKV